MRRKSNILVLLGVFLALSMAPFGGTAFAQTGNCDTTGTVNGTASPVAGVVGDTLQFRGTGFTPGEAVSFWFTLPNNGGVFGTPSPIPNGVNSDGSIGPLPFRIPAAFGQVPGRWAITFHGTPSGHESIIYFCVGFRQAAATATPVPPTATSVPPTSTTVPATATTAATATSEATATVEATATTAATAPVSTATTEARATVAASTPTTEATATTVAAAPTEVVMPSPTAMAMPTTTVPGMPTTGQGDQTLLEVMLLLSVLALGTGFGVKRYIATHR